MPEPSALPPAGWYDDPDGEPARLRWWDGHAWTSSMLKDPPGQAPREVDLPVRPIPTSALWWALFGLVAGELVGGVLAGIVEAIMGTHSTTSAAVVTAGEIGLWAGMLGSCVFVSRRWGTSSVVRDFAVGFRRNDLFIGVAVAATGVALSSIAGAVFSGSRFDGSNTNFIVAQRHNGAGFAVATVIVALGAPLFEELFFRGLVRTALRSRFGPGTAIVVQGLVFGLAHFQLNSGWGNVAVVATVAGLGIVLGFTAHKTGRLGAGMIGHGLFNLVAVLSLLTS